MNSVQSNKRCSFCQDVSYRREFRAALRPSYTRNAKHDFKLDEELPKWRGWQAARRGLGSNLYALGVQEKVIRQILRHANVSTTST